jgi:endonuclease YncB( thermonuclease family)
VVDSVVDHRSSLVSRRGADATAPFSNHWERVNHLIVSLVALIISSFATAAAAQPVTCASFDAFEWAQSVYETDPQQYAALDPDGDGVACPELGPGAAPALWTTTVPAGAEPVQLSRVVDGDTADFVLSDGTVDRVRFILIDTPETVDPSRPDGCFGQEASDFTSWLLSLGGGLYLERDVSERDQFGRLLRYVWLDLGGGEVYLVNEALARSGYAALSTFPPDVKYVEQIQAAQEFAQRHQRGLWGACSAFGAPASEPPAVPVAPPASAPPVSGAAGCDPSYPTLCLPSSPDLDCGDIADRRFPVAPPDPHRFDGDDDGLGCESG